MPQWQSVGPPSPAHRPEAGFGRPEA